MQNLKPIWWLFFFSDSPFSGGSPPHSQMCEFPILNKDSLVYVVDMPHRAISPPWLPAGPPSLWCPASCSTYRTRRSLETTTHGRRVGIRRLITWVHSSRLRVVGDGGLRASRSGLENFMQRRKWKAWATRRGIARRRSRRRRRIQRILVSHSVMGSWSVVLKLMHLHINLRRCGTWTNNLTILMGCSPPSRSNAAGRNVRAGLPRYRIYTVELHISHLANGVILHLLFSPFQSPTSQVQWMYMRSMGLKLIDIINKW